MSNPTTPFNWQMPTNTDLVTDLPADFEVFGQAVATSMADLLGGTTGQILSKNSNTDMDFVWIANDQGDITGVTATSPLTGGGTSGAITIGIQASSTTQSGAVQLTDSTSSTSTTTAATPNSVKTAFDTATTANTTANAAIPKSTVTTAGDVIYATGSSAVTRLGIGTAGQVLTVNGGATAPSWATPASTGGMTVVASGSIANSSTGFSITSIPSTYNYLQLVIRNSYSNAADINSRIRVNNLSTSIYSQVLTNGYNTTAAISAGGPGTNFLLDNYNSSRAANTSIYVLNFWDYAGNAFKTGTVTGYHQDRTTGTYEIITTAFGIQTTSALNQIDLITGTANTFAGAGTYTLYGVK
jgi:hypothetical protein